MKKVLLGVFFLPLFFNLSSKAQIIGSDFLVRLRIIQGIDSAEAAILFNPLATDGFDFDFDAPYMPGSTVNIASRIGTQNIGINVLGTFNSEKIVPLMVSPASSGTIKIRAVDLQGWFGNATLELQDLTTGVNHNLRTQSTYQVSLPAGNNTTRFKLRMKPPVNAYGVLGGCQGQANYIYVENYSGVNANYTLFAFNSTVLSSGPINNDSVVLGPFPSGSYQVNISTGSLTYPIQLNLPLPSFAARANLFALDTLVDVANNFPITFRAGNTGLSADDSLIWNFGDGTPNLYSYWFDSIQFHQYSNVGIYFPYVIAKNSQCADTASRRVQIFSITDVAALSSSKPQIEFRDNGLWVNMPYKKTEVYLYLTDVLGKAVGEPTRIQAGKQFIPTPGQLARGLYLARIEGLDEAVSLKFLQP